MPTKKIFMLAGPTASGKTKISFDLCDHFPFEIISVDSALVYKKMDIGTAKPTLEERIQYPHHLIDIIDPKDHYSAAQFVSDALSKIELIQSKDKVPLLVGGTMLYYKSLIEGLSDLPERDPIIRKKIDEEASILGWSEMYKKLMSYDPVSAKRISGNDTQRIQRALEVIELTGKPYSEIIVQKNNKPLTNFELISLVPYDRSILHDRIELRFKLMLENGFLNEVTALFEDKNLGLHLPSIRCVGYRQAWEYLLGYYDYSEFFKKSTAATRQLAKRQLTWIRNWQSSPMKCFDCLSCKDVERIYQFVENKFLK